MKQLFSSKAILYHVVVIILLAIGSVIYCKPILDKKRLVQHDIVMSVGAAHEVADYKKQTGEYSAWTNSMFGGMPSYTIMGYYPNSWTSYVASKISYIIPEPANYIFLLLLGCYIGLVALGYSSVLSLMGAVAFGFSSYTLISLEAGHVSKVMAIAYAVPLIIGILITLRGKYLVGGFITLVFLPFELYSNHVQITYYAILALVLIGLYELVQAVLSKQVKTFAIGAVLLLGIAIVAVGATASRFATLLEYTPSSIRGPSELTPLENDAPAGSGLDRDYAFSWSYGVMETFTYLIPDFYGGKSGAALSPDSRIYETIEKAYPGNAQKMILTEQWPVYWGEQPGTSGPAYMGAVVCLLALMGMFVIKNPFKWILFSIIVFFSMLAMGKNLESVNYFMFDHFPMYNKFRAVTMIHSLVSFFMVWLAVWGVDELLKLEKETYLKYLKFVCGGMVALLLLFVVMGSSLFSFEKSDSETAEQSKKDFIASWFQASQNQEFADSMYEALLEDRAHAFTSDAMRSMIFILIASGVLWMYTVLKVKKEYIIAALLVLTFMDQWQVSKRYLNDKDFKRKKKIQDEIQSTAADDMILTDKDPDYRVMNVTVSTFNDASTSYFHKSIGGYSAAKMRRYQDLIDRQISKNNMNVLNMLNTKYFIVQNPQTGEPVAQRNSAAFGNAWFVKSLKEVPTADAEMQALDSTDLRNIAVIDTKFVSKIKDKSFNADSSSTIVLTSYKPDKLTYTSESNSPQFAVFSEIYYNEGLGWQAYVNGKEVPHVRVDYILRGLEVPAGKNEIVFKFIPKTYNTFETVSLVFSIVSVLLFMVFITLLAKNSRTTTA
ncbi:MAG: YfhO family protein [Cytophagales bacterium]|nr:YfhO family protein [Cytophaga sp.]